MSETVTPKPPVAPVPVTQIMPPPVAPVIPPPVPPKVVAPEPVMPKHFRLESGDMADFMAHVKDWIRWHLSQS